MGTLINVQFSDATEQFVIGIFSDPQDERHWPNQGVILSGDPRYAQYYESQGAFARQFMVQPGE